MHAPGAAKSAASICTISQGIILGSFTRRKRGQCVIMRRKNPYRVLLGGGRFVPVRSTSTCNYTLGARTGLIDLEKLSRAKSDPSFVLASGLEPWLFPFFPFFACIFSSSDPPHPLVIHRSRSRLPFHCNTSTCFMRHSPSSCRVPSIYSGILH